MYAGMCLLSQTNEAYLTYQGRTLVVSWLPGNPQYSKGGGAHQREAANVALTLCRNNVAVTRRQL